VDPAQRAFARPVAAPCAAAPTPALPRAAISALRARRDPLTPRCFPPRPVLVPPPPTAPPRRNLRPPSPRPSHPPTWRRRRSGGPSPARWATSDLWRAT